MRAAWVAYSAGRPGRTCHPPLHGVFPFLPFPELEHEHGPQSYNNCKIRNQEGLGGHGSITISAVVVGQEAIQFSVQGYLGGELDSFINFNGDPHKPESHEPCAVMGKETEVKSSLFAEVRAE